MSPETVEYSSGRAADLFGVPSHPTVLLWHGTQTDARETVRPLAELIAAHDLSVVAPDWNSHSDDGGRGDLLSSVDFARRWSHRPESLALVGWSLGGVAAAGFTIQAAQYDIAVSHTVCLAGTFMVRDPISGDYVTENLSENRVQTPFTLVHGLGDDVVPAAVSREFAAELETVGWPVRVIELPTDHGAIAGATYDPVADRYAPGQDSRTHGVAREVAGIISTALGS